MHEWMYNMDEGRPAPRVSQDDSWKGYFDKLFGANGWDTQKGVVNQPQRVPKLAQKRR